MQKATLLRRIVVAGLFLACLTTTASAQTVHLVTVGDYRSFTGGALTGIKKDMTRITSFFTANVPKDKLKIVDVDRNMVTPDAVRQAVSSIKPDKGDTVVFYYSGHAANASDNGGQYLQLQDDKGKPASITRAEIRNTLCNSQPHLVVLLTDCCNVFMQRESKDVDSLETNPVAPDDFSPVIKELFLKPVGVLDLTSAKVGQSSLAISSGSIATTAWVKVFNEINDELKKDPSAKKTWRDIVHEMVVVSDKIFKKEFPNGERTTGQKTQVPHILEYPGIPRLGVRVFTLEGGNVQVGEVTSQSPGANAGIKVGDIILSINGTEILDEPDYSRTIDQAPRQTKITIKRDKQEQTLNAELHGLPVEPTPDPSTVAGANSGEASASLDPNVYNQQNNQGRNNENGQNGRQSGGNSTSKPVFGASVQGNKIVKVVEDSPAAYAGLEVGDRLVKFNDTTIRSAEDFSKAVDDSPEEAKLIVQKEGKRPEKITVWLNPSSNNGDNSSDSDNSGDSGDSGDSDPVFGASVQGNKIVKVVKDSPAANAGLEVDDLILKFNGTEIKKAEDFSKAVDDSEATATLTIKDHRTGQEKEIEVQLNK